MRSFAIASWFFAATTVSLAISSNDAVTVTVTACAAETAATVLTTTASYTSTVAPTETISNPIIGATLGPVANPLCDTSNLGNIRLKKNFTLHYGSNDPTTPDTNAEISMQFKFPSVLLEEIDAVKTVVCSDSGVVVTFADLAAYKMSFTKWPATGEFIFITNHLGNCDEEFERGLFLVESVTFDENLLTVTATAEKSDFETVAGSMEIDFGQNFSPLPSNSTAPYSNSSSSALASRNINWDPTYSLNFDKALPSDTVIASIQPYLEVVANTATFTSSASFKGHLSYNFWKARVSELYFDINIAYDANLRLTGKLNASYQDSLAYAPDILSISPVNIPGILTLGPALNFAIGVQIVASADLTVTTHTQVTLANGVAHVDMLTQANTATSGWKPTYVAEATVSGDAGIQLNPYVQLEIELAVKFLGGLVDLSSGVRAKATLTNELTVMNLSAATSTNGGSTALVPSGAVNGVCQDGFKYKSDFIFAVIGFVTKFYTATIYSATVPVFEKCWASAKTKRSLDDLLTIDM